MQTTTALLAIFCCTMLGLALIWTRRLRGEIAFLPTEGQSSVASLHPLIGLQLADAMPWPEHLKQREAVVMFSSPTCPPCQKEIEDYLQAFQGNAPALPLLVVLRAEKQDAYEKYVKKYGDLVQIISADDQLLHEQLQVTAFPTACLVDARGVVTRVERPMVKLFAQTPKATAPTEQHRGASAAANG
ncbi:TlpA family protein disulfide reductase [Tumebacillus lipolyticus]|uniref:TlpA family protein disulfide reductase n=1 Tax=Tumebacillus lipolyticus TaxID=1280370 RepID=A0ABW4ZZ93_9BACL